VQGLRWPGPAEVSPAAEAATSLRLVRS
jgi:hypothetical protein